MIKVLKEGIMIFRRFMASKYLKDVTALVIKKIRKIVPRPSSSQISENSNKKVCFWRLTQDFFPNSNNTFVHQGKQAFSGEKLLLHNITA